MLSARAQRVSVLDELFLWSVTQPAGPLKDPSLPSSRELDAMFRANLLAKPEAQPSVSRGRSGPSGERQPRSCRTPRKAGGGPPPAGTSCKEAKPQRTWRSAPGALTVGQSISYQMDYASEVSPVQKVIQLMQNMASQGEKEMQDEKVQFATYSQWCTMTQDKKTQLVADAADAIESMQADVDKVTANIERLASEISGHQKEIEALSLEQDNITQVRSAENADYKVAKKDYVESIDALDRAVATLKKQAYDRKQASGEEASLLEMPEVSGISQRHSKEVKKAISAFIQSSKKPEVAGYEFQSEGVLSMLSDLQDKFVLEKAELDKTEFEKKAAYERTLAGLKNEEDSEQKGLDKKTALKSKKMQQKAQLQDNLESTKSTKTADEEYLKDTTTTCQQKASDFEERQKLRVEELEAVNKAIDVMSSSSVSGNEKKHLAKSFVQVSRSTSLASLWKGHIKKEVQDKLVAFLQSEADRLQSKVLANLVAPTAASAAMVSIKDMLQSLLDKLQNEATQEQTKKDHCNKEIKTNKATRAEKTASIDELQADIDMLEASVKQLKEEAAALGEDIGELDQSVANATELRGKEKAKNNETMTDAKAAQDAVAQALSVLKEFYEKAGQATALLQTNTQSDQPAIFDAPYKGMGGESGGVLGLLEAIAADFAKLESETASEEEAGADSYKSFMQESKLNKKRMELDMKHKQEIATEQAADIQEKSNELIEVQKELDASQKVWETLQDECLNTGKSYQEQKEQREETIESLQKALDMLSL